MGGADTFREQENTQQSLVQSSDSSASVIVLALYCAETQRSMRIKELLKQKGTGNYSYWSFSAYVVSLLKTRLIVGAVMTSIPMSGYLMVYLGTEK